MSKRLSASKLRENVYRILDEVIETGQPVEVLRRGQVISVAPVLAGGRRRLAGMVVHPEALVGDPQDLVHVDWSGEWVWSGEWDQSSQWKRPGERGQPGE